MKKYLIREEIPYQGYNQWTVFSISSESAKTIVKMFSHNYSGEPLSIISEKIVKGRKMGTDCIHKYTSKINR